MSNETTSAKRTERESCASHCTWLISGCICPSGAPLLSIATVYQIIYSVVSSCGTLLLLRLVSFSTSFASFRHLPHHFSSSLPFCSPDSMHPRQRHKHLVLPSNTVPSRRLQIGFCSKRRYREHPVTLPSQGVGVLKARLVNLGRTAHHEYR